MLYEQSSHERKRMRTKLSDETIAALLEKARTGNRGNGELFGGEKHFTANGWEYGKVTTDMKGEFVGKQGTTVRSRKGRTYHAPNGSRRYEEQWWVENPVLAYKV